MVNGWTNLRLPIGVVIPTRNSMAYLPEHVAGMRAWVDLVREMVLVDSFSADGTVDYVRQHLRHPRLRVLTHPPGLYASWNHGIAHVTSPYTYVATLGDTASRTGLQHLFSVTGQLHCDVCLSPPRFIDPQGGELAGIRWPIHAMIERLGITAPRLLHQAEVLFFAVTSGGNSVLGSSASNLYRTAVLRKFPFPTDYESAGDTAWGLLHWSDATFGVTTRSCANFLCHPREPPAQAAALHARFAALAEETLRAAIAKNSDLAACPELKCLRDLLRETQLYRQQRQRLDEYRRRNVLWIFDWRAWQARRQRNRHRKQVRALRARVGDSALLRILSASGTTFAPG